MIAVLPMYDWPEVFSFTDRLWTHLSEHLNAAGIKAPKRLERTMTQKQAWLSPELVLGQTCGLPYVNYLRDEVQLIGTPDYQIDGCPNGWYRSAIIVRSDDDRTDLSHYRGTRFVTNGNNSQSGYEAIVQSLGRNEPLQQFFNQTFVSGAHRESIISVADGQADIACIDYVTWRLAQEFLPQIDSLRVLDLTIPMPGLPFIAHQNIDYAITVNTVEKALNSLDLDIVEALQIYGLWRSTPQDYDVIFDQRSSIQYPAAHTNFKEHS